MAPKKKEKSKKAQPSLWTVHWVSLFIQIIAMVLLVLAIVLPGWLAVSPLAASCFNFF